MLHVWTGTILTHVSGTTRQDVRGTHRTRSSHTCVTRHWRTTWHRSSGTIRQVVCGTTRTHSCGTCSTTHRVSYRTWFSVTIRHVVYGTCLVCVSGTL